MQWQLKAHPAYDGKPLSDFLLRKELHRLAGNPWQSWNTAGVLVVNPTGLRQTYYVPGTWKGAGQTDRIRATWRGNANGRARPLDNLLGPVELEPFSWQVIPWPKLEPAPAAESVRTGGDFIETDHYRLTFDPATGKVTGLFDQQRQRPVVAAESPWGFFQLVHERPSNNERSRVPRPQRRRRAIRPYRLETRLAGDADQLIGEAGLRGREAEPLGDAGHSRARPQG